MSGRDCRDDVIAELAESERDLLEQLARSAERAVLAEADRDAFRLLAVQALHNIHDLQGALAATTARYRRALDHTRALHEQVRHLQRHDAADGAGASGRVAA